MDFTVLTQTVEQMGALHAAVIPVGQLTFDPIFRKMCEANACGNYGKCWMCPPVVGKAEDLISEAKTYDYVLVYQTVGTLEDSYDWEGMMQAAARQNELARSLSEYFGTLPFAKKLHLGAGGCHVCETCAKRQDAPCRFPEKAMSSLETYCIHVSEMASAAGMHYTNGQNTVTYFGALLFTEEQQRG